MGSGGKAGQEWDSDLYFRQAAATHFSLEWNFVPRKMEFKGWVTDSAKSSIQGITDDEVLILVRDLKRMVPRQAHKWIDWDQTRKEQGTWPTKTMVSGSKMKRLQ